MKNNLTTLKRVQKCLRDVLLPVQGTGLDWQILKNLSKLDAYLERKKASLLELEKKYALKDSTGEPILYEVTATSGGLGEFNKDAQGDFIVAGPEYKGIKLPRLDYENKDYLAALGELHDDVDFNFHVLDATKLEAAFNEGKFSGLDLTPLVGTLIILDNDN